MAVKGKTNNPNGRPKGSKNRADKHIKEAFEDVLRRNASEIDAYIEEIYKEHGAKEVMEMILKVAEFCVPKLSRAEVNNNTTVTVSSALSAIEDPDKLPSPPDTIEGTIIEPERLN